MMIYFCCVVSGRIVSPLNFVSVDKTPSVWPFKWTLLSSTFMWYCLLCCTRWLLLNLWITLGSGHSNESFWAYKVVLTFLVCGWNPSVWPFKWKIVSCAFLYYCFISTQAVWNLGRSHLVFGSCLYHFHTASYTLSSLLTFRLLLPSRVVNWKADSLTKSSSLTTCRKFHSIYSIALRLSCSRSKVSANWRNSIQFRVLRWLIMNRSQPMTASSI